MPATPVSGHTAGARVDPSDPLAVLAYGKSQAATGPRRGSEHPKQQPGDVVAPMQATIVSFEIAVGEVVRKGQEVAVLNAMKMEHVLRAPVAGGGADADLFGEIGVRQPSVPLQQAQDIHVDPV